MFKIYIRTATTDVVNGTASDVSLLAALTRIESLCIDEYEKSRCIALYNRIRNKDITRNDVLRELHHILEYRTT